MQVSHCVHAADVLDPAVVRRDHRFQPGAKHTELLLMNASPGGHSYTGMPRCAVDDSWTCRAESQRLVDVPAVAQGRPPGLRWSAGSRPRLAKRDTGRPRWVAVGRGSMTRSWNDLDEHLRHRAFQTEARRACAETVRAWRVPYSPLFRRCRSPRCARCPRLGERRARSCPLLVERCRSPTVFPPWPCLSPARPPRGPAP